MDVVNHEYCSNVNSFLQCANGFSFKRIDFNWRNCKNYHDHRYIFDGKGNVVAKLPKNYFENKGALLSLRQMISEDWVSVKFGRDVASLIHFHAWRRLMDIVNSDYCLNMSLPTEIMGLCVQQVEFNWRNNDDHRFVFKGQTGSVIVVANLPKNYFQIKELY